MQTLLFESAIRATLIAAVIALVLFAMRIKAASVLHAVWAGVVFLMMLLPAWMAWGPVRQTTPTITLPAVDTPATAPVQVHAESASPQQSEAPIVIGIYLLGLGVLLLRLLIGTFRANRLTSASCVVPVTVGLLHPRIILPASSYEWPHAQLDAVLAHEGEHIRRRDPLFQWIALLNRAIFWFHPLAWWLERRISGLAEEACDAAVIAHGYDAREYSEYLLDLARSVERAGARIDAVGMAMPGIGLKHRIRQLLSGVRVPRISRPRMACTIAVCAGAAAILAAGTLVHAQSAQPRPKFEVASIKPCDDDIPLGGRGGGGNITPGRMTLNCQTVRGYIGAAYAIFANGRSNLPPLPPLPPVEGGPSWIDSERYTIVAKAEDSADSGMMQGPMLQMLLEDRFKLKIRRETREVPVYELTVAKGGPKLKQHQEGSCVRRPPIDLTKPIERPILPPGQRFCAALGALKGPNMVMDAEAISINEYSKIFFVGMDRPVIDKTGIIGEYDIHLEYAPGDELRSRLAENGRDPGESTAPSIFTALQEQLGLKLESAKGPREFLVIDHVEKPSEN